MNCKFILVHSKLAHHFHKGLDSKGIMLHGHTELLAHIFFFNVLGLDQAVLFHHLSGIA